MWRITCDGFGSPNSTCTQDTQDTRMSAITPKRLFPLTAYMAILALLALRSDYHFVIESLFETVGDLVLHAMAYASLGVLSYWTFRPDGITRSIVAFSVTFIYSLILESLQLFVPGRFFSFADIAVNLAACGLGAVLPLALRKSEVRTKK